MRILLLGEYSNVHNNLAKGLRTLGHEVVLANDGDHWKNFERDIDLSRKSYSGNGIFARIGNIVRGLQLLLRLILILPRMRGYDVVQIINPTFLPLKAERHFQIYKYLRKHNNKMVMCAMGDDYYYCHVNRTLKPMRYSDYNIGQEEHITDFARWTYNDKVGTAKERLCRMIAADCDAIVAGAYEYWLPYNITNDTDEKGHALREKLHSIALPVCMDDNTSLTNHTIQENDSKVRIFIGISRGRSEFKGTDIMLKAAQQLQCVYPDKVELQIAEGVPFNEYRKMMDTSDIILDQLYSYGPGMNALLAMSKGMVTLTGGEPEHYELLGEKECRPIVNVTPSYNDVYEKLEQLVLHPEQIARLKEQSIAYIKRNHDALHIAKQYEQVYSQI